MASVEARTLSRRTGVGIAASEAEVAAPMTVLNVDRIRCDGRGMCAELLPELLDLDEWGYPIVRVAQVPADLMEHARRAVTACPVLAFRLFENPSAAAQITPGIREPR